MLRRARASRGGSARTRIASGLGSRRCAAWRCRRRKRFFVFDGTQREAIIVYFRITGVGAQAPGPIEKIALTAAAAEIERSNLQRLCGRSGRVEVSGKDGRTISPERLRRLAQDEAVPARSNKGTLHVPGPDIQA